MIVQFVKFKSALSPDEVKKMMEERLDQYRRMPGLLQKYYFLENETGEFGGIYVWDSMDSLKAFRQSELAKSIPTAYKAQGTPRIELLDVIEVLHSPTPAH